MAGPSWTGKALADDEFAVQVLSEGADMLGGTYVRSPP
jgi:hypothetical protein